MRHLLVLVFFCGIVLSVRPVSAWNEVGHMTVARIAWDKLSDGERSAVVAMLSHHPHLNELLLKGRPAHVAQSEWIFVRAATWPDSVRPPQQHHNEPMNSHSIHRFHHPTWHYANFEYRAGQRETALPDHTLPHAGRVSPGTGHSAPDPSSLSHSAESTDIIEQLDHSWQIIRGKEREYSRPEIEFSQAEIRAIRLCWLMHLTGDIHQPLHVATLVDPRIPLLQHGDEGGNKLAIRINQTSAPKKLHAVWDDLIGNNPHFDRVVQLAERITHDPQFAESRLPEFSSHKYSWEFAEESYQAAKEVVYQNGQIRFVPWASVESREVAVDDVPVMPPSSLDRAHVVAQRRIALAGYRLSARLKYIVSRDNTRPVSAGVADSPAGSSVPTRRFVR